MQQEQEEQEEHEDEEGRSGKAVEEQRRLTDTAFQKDHGVEHAEDVLRVQAGGGEAAAAPPWRLGIIAATRAPWREGGGEWKKGETQSPGGGGGKTQTQWSP